MSSANWNEFKRAVARKMGVEWGTPVPPSVQTPAPPAPPPLVPVDHEILAWRGWNLDLDEIKLAPLMVYGGIFCDTWAGPTAVADQVPSLDTTSGLYALKEPNYRLDGDVVGQVALSGIVLEGTTGYRAERAAIRSLTLRSCAHPRLCPLEVASILEERYKVDVEVRLSPPSSSLATFVFPYRIQWPGL